MTVGLVAAIEKEPGVMVEFTGDGGLDTTSDDSEQLGGEVTSPMSKAANRHSKQEVKQK